MFRKCSAVKECRGIFACQGIRDFILHILMVEIVYEFCYIVHIGKESEKYE